MIRSLAADAPVQILCRILGVSRSGYYAWGRREPGRQAQTDAQMMVAVRRIFTESRQTYGSPRVTAALRQAGQVCNHKRVERLMRQAGLSGRSRKRFRVQTTDSQHELPIAPNRLSPAPPCTAPDQVWLTDITYIWTQEGWLFLTCLLDLYSRKIVGWAMGESLATTLPLLALRMALTRRQPGKGLLHHSDRGVQFASQDYRRQLALHGLLASMSRKGNCYDNAAMESFWSTLKQELVYRCQFQTRAQARQAIFEWIEVFYNRTRLHSSLGFHSPVDFENQLN
jgi:putative transposase